jgi:small subunit ribosomal protein S4
MARERGPRLKKCRAVGIILPGLTTKTALDRPYPPGVHGARRRGKQSDYKVRLIEKQKLRWHYGILEKQFRSYVRRANRLRGPSGNNLVRILECRLDNIVWRLGLAPTMPAARQLVSHRHIVVDGTRVDRPSFQVKPGMEIKVLERSLSRSFIQEALERATTRVRPDYLEFDPAKATGRMVALPGVEDLPFPCNTQAIIEFYSQTL